MRLSLEQDALFSLRGRDVLSLGPRARGRIYEAAFRLWRSRPFPYPILDPDEVADDFGRLLALDPSRALSGRSLRPLATGVRTANTFQPAMWHIKHHGRSVADLFYDDASLAAAIRKSAELQPGRRCWRPHALRSALRVLHRVRLSNFRPAVARFVIAKYSRDQAAVLDPCMGFGGRLLGALSLHRQYYGIDVEAQQIRGSKAMLRAVEPQTSGTATLQLGRAEAILPACTSSSVDLVFTSPPYFAAEKYSLSKLQSFRAHRDYDSWRHGFLEVLLEESARLLTPRGWLVLMIDNSRSWPILEHTLQMARRWFRLRQIYHLRQSLPPGSPSGVSNTEPILAFQRLPRRRWAQG